MSTEHPFINEASNPYLGVAGDPPHLPPDDGRTWWALERVQQERIEQLTAEVAWLRSVVSALTNQDPGYT